MIVMLIHGSDKERAFDLAVQRSFPYLIFPPIHDSYDGLDYDEFRNKLINNLVALYHYKNGNDDVTFYKQNEEIRNMLESSIFDRVTSAEIEGYRYQQMTVDRAIRDMAKTQSEFEHRLKSLEHIKKKAIVCKDPMHDDACITPNNMPPVTTLSKTNIDLVYEQLVNNPKNVYSEIELAEVTGLSRTQIKCVFGNIYSKEHPHNDKIPHIKNTVTKYKPNPNLREYPMQCYQYVEIPENE